MKEQDKRISCSLCRFRIEDEKFFYDTKVSASVKKAFNEYRCFPFFPDAGIVDRIKQGENILNFEPHFNETAKRMLQEAPGGIVSKFLSRRITFALMCIHYAMSIRNFNSLFTRRIVLIKEMAGVPTIHHLSNESTVISHIGQGPDWAEIPTLYLGLNTFSAIQTEIDKGKYSILGKLASLLMVEERAIEMGYVHELIYPSAVSIQIMELVNTVLDNFNQRVTISKETGDDSAIPKFSEDTRKTLLRELDARLNDEELNFDYARNIKALQKIENLARRYKRRGDEESLREVTRLLVAASGHDIHEIRNKANIVLERVFAPKEFDAPIASRFINTYIGKKNKISFTKPKGKEHFLRLYRNPPQNVIATENNISFEDIELLPEGETLSCEYTFNEYGHYDFTLMSRDKEKSEWLKENEYSGRVNVIPDIRGEIVLEIFVDIHGHTKAYWRAEDSHPGLLYNENGEIIRLGNLNDISAHLEHIKNTYSITSIYLLGTQERGDNKEDWAWEATSPSPFSPISLVDIEPSLGGKQALKELTAKAHSLDIKIIVDIVPHVNRRSSHINDTLVVMTYDGSGNLVQRSSTDGRYGSWNDGKLLNYRKFEIWEWLLWSINKLIDDFDIDGIRFDSAHAVPIMMKKNNYPLMYGKKRSHEDMVEGRIIVNEREYDHFITTGYFDCICRDQIAVPIHYYLMLGIERKLKEKKKSFFINIAECFWGHEQFLTRSGLIPYNSSLFKICEGIIHGKTDVREIYHIYDNYFPAVLPEGTELLGILGNHDERRALNTFGERGLRPAIGLTFFMHGIVMDYEGSAEGESWKVFLDNIYVNWNQFESVATRSLFAFYRDWYHFHNKYKGKGYLLWANNNMVAAAIKFADNTAWIGAFNFADSNQSASIQFDNPNLPIRDDAYYKLSDIIYSDYTGKWSYFTGKELKVSRLRTLVSYTERIKIFKLEKADIEENYSTFLADSFIRLAELSKTENINSNFAFSEIAANAKTYENIQLFFTNHIKPLLDGDTGKTVLHALKRAFFYLFKLKMIKGDTLIEYSKKMSFSSNEFSRSLGLELAVQHKRGPIVFISAEANPFSKSGGLANVVYELPSEMAKLNEEVYVITGYYKHGSDKERQIMADSVKKYNIRYTGVNVSFFIMGEHFEVGVHSGQINGVTYFLLEHHTFFDGLYWGYTAAEKLYRRIAFARACAEVIASFKIYVRYTFTNDAYIGIFNGIVRCDPYYINNEYFKNNTFLHIIHNGGWQYFDVYDRFENGFDFFNFFNLPSWRAGEFCDPVHENRLNCMATGIRFADRVITVSPSYAVQIEYACDGMERILENVTGISNAIGRDFRQSIQERFDQSGFVEKNYGPLVQLIKENAALLEKIESRYPEILAGALYPESIKDATRSAITVRMRNKLLFQFERNLKVDPDIILFCMIHRISEQKGFQLLLESSEGIFKYLGYQACIGGAVASGDNRGRELASGLYQIQSSFHENVTFSEGYQEVAIPLLSADLFCMPSMHEPGGISQLEAFAAGCLVVARATGGLRDTVIPIQIQDDKVNGNGFLFSDYHSWAFYDAMQRAMNFFRNNSAETIQAGRFNAEKSVYYWDKPARKYIETMYDITETIRVLNDEDEA